MKRCLALVAAMGIAFCIFAGTARADDSCQQGLSAAPADNFTTIAIDQANDRYAFLYWGRLNCPVKSFPTLGESYPDQASFDDAVQSNLGSNWLGIADKYKAAYEDLKDAILVKEIMAKKKGEVTLYAIPKEACTLAKDGQTFWCQYSEPYGEKAVKPNQWSDLDGKSRSEEISIVSDRLQDLFETYGGSEKIASQYRMAAILRSSTGGQGFDDMKQAVDDGTNLPDADQDGIVDAFDSAPQEANLVTSDQDDQEGDDSESGDADSGNCDRACIIEAATTYMRKDFDHDGVKNIADLCADTPEGAAVDEHGCPVLQASDDVDGDGIADVDDACPDVAGGEGSEDGCPVAPDASVDTDEDGVLDVDDLCPGTPAGEDGAQGCPQLGDGGSCSLTTFAGSASPMSLLMLLPLLPLTWSRRR